MLSLSLNQILVLYTWFPLAALLFFLMLIGRFYERFSGQRTRFRWFVLPILLFGAAAVRYASSGRLTSDLLGDVLAAAGGVILIYLSISLYHLMTTNR